MQEQRNVCSPRWKMFCSASLVILAGTWQGKSASLHPPNQHSCTPSHNGKGTWGKSFCHNPREHLELSEGREGKWESAEVAEYILSVIQPSISRRAIFSLWMSSMFLPKSWISYTECRNVVIISWNISPLLSPKPGRESAWGRGSDRKEKQCTSNETNPSRPVLWESWHWIR